ncbi:unnamed protein product, partial [Mesorhabditis belari]|uniref:Uncharacterized protein n=1 Tax=Mesorhabditis belari TaxID=2138241 RepID=A0AAF3J486_9BILA
MLSVWNLFLYSLLVGIFWMKEANAGKRFDLHDRLNDSVEDWLLLLSTFSERKNTTILPSNLTNSSINDRLETNKTTIPLSRGKSSGKRIWPGKLCRKYTEIEKYKMLGGRNLLFLANSIDEAAEHFGPLDAGPDEYFLQNNDVVISLQEDDYMRCDFRCQRIKEALSAAKFHSKSTLRKKLNDDIIPEVEVQEGRAPCSLDDFIATNNCSMSQVYEEEEILCARCHGVFNLGRGCFPRYLNAVRCEGKDTGCIYDRWTNLAHGKCRPQRLSFRILQNIGDDECEVWKIVNIQLPVACNCLLNSNSALLISKPAIGS